MSCKPGKRPACSKCCNPLRERTGHPIRFLCFSRSVHLVFCVHGGLITCTERRGHAEGLDVGRDVGHGGHEAVVERVQLLRACDQRNQSTICDQRPG